MLAYVVYGLLILMDMPMSSDATADAPQLVGCETAVSDYIQGEVNWGNTLIRCPSDCAATSHTVYGNGPFSIDASICRAAIFAGKITDSGGVVDVHYVGKSDLNTGPDQNGVEIRGSPPWVAFDFQAADPNQIRDVRCDETLDDLFVVTGNHGVRKVRCPSGCVADQHDVYGTGPFTRDSAICTAAIFAGYIADNGGVVDVHWLPQQPTFASGNRSGGVR
jgi:hypothetical protein